MNPFVGDKGHELDVKWVGDALRLRVDAPTNDGPAIVILRGVELERFRIVLCEGAALPPQEHSP